MRASESSRKKCDQTHTNTHSALEQRHCSHNTTHVDGEWKLSYVHIYIHIHISTWRQASKNYTKEITNWNDEAEEHRHTHTYKQSLACIGFTVVKERYETLVL